MARNPLLVKMLERVYTAISTGPALNCRPHASRQRLDLAQLARLDEGPSARLLAALLGSPHGGASQAGSLKLSARQPRAPEGLSPEQARERVAEREEEQRKLLGRLRTIAEEARTFEQETGAQVLFVGFPLLQLPPRKGPGGAESKRLLAPLAFVPVSLSVKAGPTPAVELACTGEGPDRVIPNPALLAWLAQQAGARLEAQPAEESEAPAWEELAALTARVCQALELPAPKLAPEAELEPVARAEDESAQAARVVPGAVLGLFPLGNQNLVDDLEAMAEGDALAGPVDSFLRANLGLTPRAPGEVAPASAEAPSGPDRLVAEADPCQARAVRLARASRGLVIHGPPGTGKSQTIANVIGDHLARGERVLFVCDKRTALDVVKYRLDHLGLGGLCAIVHDARRDQRDLYMGLREQLDGLAEAKAETGAEAALAEVDRELAKLHAEAGGYLAKLSQPEGGRSFHELAGAWAALPALPAFADRPVEAPALLPEALAGREHELAELFERAAQVGFRDNLWRGQLAPGLREYLAQPLEAWRAASAATVQAAQAVDAAPADLPLSSELDLRAQGEARASLADRLAELLTRVEPARLAAWAREPVDLAHAARLAELEPHLALLRRPLDVELSAALQAAPADLATVSDWARTLAAYEEGARKWYGGLLFGVKSHASSLLRRFGLTLGEAQAARVRAFLEGVRARLMLQAWVAQQPGAAPGPLPEAELRRAVEDHVAIIQFLAGLGASAELRPCAAPVRAALADAEARAGLAERLRRSAARARALAELRAKLAPGRLHGAEVPAELAALRSAVPSGKLYGPVLSAALVTSACQGEPVAPRLEALHGQFDTIEGLLHLEAGLAALPATLGPAARGCLERGHRLDESLVHLQRTALANALQQRLRADPSLQEIDGERLRAAFDRYGLLLERRATETRAHVRSLWLGRQRARLLASTGSRLNSEGAELRRRLFTRGERALKVRQVIAAGARLPGGDPLFDLRPVWMASPATVAQIFPRLPTFDVVVFDEASQCRLEEALPVLTRARRVVIAGDPKQLPPTRFFESAVAQSQEAEPETEQELFEAQQAEAEDLLSAALNLALEQSYLDVHYRSANADLIAFSNERFYEGRLQPIPGRPGQRTARAPVRLVAVGGTYEKRVNRAEAAAVVARVRELLAQPEPPSLGIACFNLAQRDELAEALEQAALADPVFAERLAVARARTGAGSFEGLFVKNLESVQGDERDVVLISTTYGPDPKGRFYRRFGPLGQAGGGRRLNVLVTRARQAVELFTSIPAEAYRSAAPLAPGQAPSGVWLLFAYLRFAEGLQQSYARPPGEAAALAGQVAVRPAAAGSLLAECVARQLAAQRGLSSEVHWGNDGFRVDVALADGALGLLCDGARYPKAPDALEWDVFRTRVLEAQGWRLLRLWSPHFFRDPAGALARVAAEAATPGQAQREAAT